jgi:hypothetical protein
LNALCHFLWTADGLTNAQVRPLVASLLGTAYSTRQMGYDLRRLTRKGLIARIDQQHRYVLTPYGRRVALFLTKVHARVLRGPSSARPEFHRTSATAAAHDLSRTRPRHRRTHCGGTTCGMTDFRPFRTQSSRASTASEAAPQTAETSRVGCGASSLGWLLSQPRYAGGLSYLAAILPWYAG